MLHSEPVEITGLKVGIIGLGVSGKMIADALSFLGADISYYSRTRKPEAEQSGMVFLPLDELLAESEVVFTCLNKNVLLLGKQELDISGNGKVLSNTSIGPVFDATKFSDEYCRYGEFTGTMVGITCADRVKHKHYADFDFFEYKTE